VAIAPLSVRQSKLRQKSGVPIANDVTARDLQQRDSQWTRAKGFDTFCPLGPWIVRELNPSTVADFINDDAEPVHLLLGMVFSPDVLVSYISQIMTLLPEMLF